MACRGTCRVGEKGRRGLQGQTESAWQPVEGTFMKTRSRLLLGHITSKYFLSVFNVPAAVPGSTEGTAVAGMGLILVKGRQRIMEERNNGTT